MTTAPYLTDGIHVQETTLHTPASLIRAHREAWEGKVTAKFRRLFRPERCDTATPVSLHPTP